MTEPERRAPEESPRRADDVGDGVQPVSPDNAHRGRPQQRQPDLDGHESACDAQAVKKDKGKAVEEDSTSSEDDEKDDDEEDEEEDDDEEPQLKYARMTQHLAAVYRNGDATSTFVVAGDKMIIGTHNGNIHVVQLPTFQSLRVYHAHSASVTSTSISPFPPPLPGDEAYASLRQPASQVRQGEMSSPAATSRRTREIQQLPKLPSNEIYIATSSMDGNVCIQSLIDVKDVQLRNFARPVQAVALSPEYKVDRTYLSGGLGGQLILTVGGGAGRSTSTTTGTAAAAASGWLGSVGLGHNTGKDSVLHSGEGSISCIKWSLSGKYVVWLNEFGIKVMRSKLHLESGDSDHAWKRMAHIDRPQTDEWETMASVWKGRVEWIDEKTIDADDVVPKSSADSRPREQTTTAMERLLVGWGGTIWIIHVHPGTGVGKTAGQRALGRAEIAKIFRMDCIISGISLYTQGLLLVLAFCTSDGDDSQDRQARSSSRGSRRRARSGSTRPLTDHHPPELRLIDLGSQTEVDKISLNMSRYERLSSADYHLGVLPAHTAASAAASKGTLEALAGLGTDVWNAAINPKSLFSSGASIMSKDSGDDVGSSSKAASTAGTIRSSRPTALAAHPSLAKPGAKIFIQSPYDCVLATKRDLADHLSWLLERELFQRAWELLDENPDIVTASTEKTSDFGSLTPSKNQSGADDFYDDESAADASHKAVISFAEKEKRRIGELWIQELIEEGDWKAAGEVCGRVLTTPDRWERWVWAFAGANKFDEIASHMPARPLQPPLPSTIYEVVLGHYLQNNKPRFRELLDTWPTDLFNVSIVCTALENQLKFRDVREDSVDDGIKSRDWRIVMRSLSGLYEVVGRNREALKCYIKLHDADSAFRLIRDGHLAEAVADDIPSFIGLRVDPERLEAMTRDDLAEATSEAITLLVDEAQHGLVRPETVVEQLKGQGLDLYLYFYLKGLWRGEGIQERTGETMDRLVMDSQSLVDDFADLAVHLFSVNDRPMLMEFLKSSTSYTFEKAVQECEDFEYHDELVYLYSKTGQTKRALFLIIDGLKNVEKAIEFAKEQDDPDLWEDLLKYSMDKPAFIRALLEQVGTAINPVTLIRRIPEGLAIKGLREGLSHMMKEHELQHSVNSGAVRVLRSELAAAQNELRAGQRRGIKFEVVPPAEAAKEEGNGTAAADGRKPRPGRCASCGGPLTELETETLLGFACGHVFHLSHLLEMLHQRPDTGFDAGDEGTEERRRSVGIKVMRARLLRDKVKGGCPICQVRE
ncbi:hypothetical protein L249_0032 [Ophiocordyceps polyrhachis-furcata BCC 54312]|uniref:Vps41 beta-propeller domain-containing protein n=1 Tax=Ophiocordyceps polyrhachis-furcata BCC 54312 TaxID=1330021 RepID=A0A367LEU7_9HYPO|nr:hypothetical protein L249_0032 [Ophiocordyceps polyrhachis-furcata BCC 54312]